MIEKFTKDELVQLITELKTAGYSIDNDSKAFLFQRARMETDMPFVHEDIRKSIYDIADTLTDNYTQKDFANGRIRRFKNKDVPEDKRKVYGLILRGLLGAIKPYICSVERTSR